MRSQSPPRPAGTAADAVRRALEEARGAGLWPPGGGVLVACSGGPDSMALLHALVVRRGETGDPAEVAAAHVDHGLRPDSRADADAVARLAASLDIPCHVAAVTVEGEGGPQAAARRVRYQALERLRTRAGCAVVATAHTADDEAETVLLRLARGTSLDGLAGIPRQRGNVVRPLLGVRRTELRAYCEAAGLEPRDDPSNRSDAFLRPRVRHEVLPLLARRLNPRIVEALTRLARSARDDAELLDALASELLERCTVDAGPVAPVVLELEAAPLREAHPAVGRRVLRRAWRAASAAAVDRVEAEPLEQLLEAVRRPPGEPRAFTLPGGVTARVGRGRVTFEPTPGAGGESSDDLGG